MHKYCDADRTCWKWQLKASRGASCYCRMTLLGQAGELLRTSHILLHSEDPERSDESALRLQKIHTDAQRTGVCKEMCWRCNCGQIPWDLHKYGTIFWWRRIKGQTALASKHWRAGSGKTKAATSDHFFGLWWLILCQRNNSHFKRRRGGADETMADWSIGPNSSVPCDVIIH